MPGAETLTVTDAAVVAMKPEIVALTVVVPPLIGANATPPVATVVGENDWFPSIVTVRVCADPPVVVNCPTVLLLLVIVAVRLPPNRTAWIAFRFAFPAAGTPSRT